MQIILWEDFKEIRKKWYMIIIGLCVTITALGFFVFHANYSKVKIEEQNREYVMKNVILKEIKNKKVNISDALKITDTIVSRSKELYLPVDVIVGVINNESFFNINAVSRKGAVGLMQIHPLTWTEYNRRMGLDLNKKKVLDPVTNIIMGTQVLYDLRDKYHPEGLSENDLWNKILGAYYAGEGSVLKGLNKGHKAYSKKVLRFAENYRRVLKNANI